MIEQETPRYRFLVWAAVGTAIFVVGSMFYRFVFSGEDLGELNYRRGTLRLDDGKYAEALTEFQEHLKKNPLHASGYVGKAQALMGLGDNQAALQEFETALSFDPKHPGALANRGILNDRMGRYQEALADYRAALKLEPDLGDGPGWLTRFFRSQWEPPPTIADRAKYLEAELKKPPRERRLQNPEEDAKQRSYTFEAKR